MTGSEQTERLERSLARLRTEFLGSRAARVHAPQPAAQATQPSVAAQVGRLGSLFGAFRMRWIGKRR